MQGLQQNVPSYGSMESAYGSATTASSSSPSTASTTPTRNASYTIIMIDDDDYDSNADGQCNEKTSLLKHHAQDRTYYTKFGSIQSMPSALSGYNNEFQRSASANTGMYRNPWIPTGTAKSIENRMCDLRLILFGGFLLTSLMLALYLLIIETRIPALGFSLDLVNRDIWSKMSMDRQLNHENVRNVLVMQTRGKSCDDTDSCIDELKQMQSLESTDEIPYNFLIGSDGQTYEIRGWDYESGNALMPQNKTLVIGFIGDYTKNQLSQVQQQSGNSLLRESVKRNKLQKDYDVYGLRNLTISSADGEQLLQALSKWPRFKMPFNVT